jgi:hypothetical protein
VARAGGHDQRVSAPEPLLQLLESQLGLATTGQLQAAGLTRAEVRWKLGRSWRLVLPHVVATFTGQLDLRQRLVAAQLLAGPGGMISGPTAARWHGLSLPADGAVHVEVPHHRRPRSAGFVMVRRTRMPDARPWNRPPLVVVSRPRAVASAARAARDPTAATAVVLEAVQRRLVRLEDLRHELEAGPRAGSALLRGAVTAAERGAWSVPEAELGHLLRSSRVLPTAWFNPDLFAADGTRLPRPDAWLDDVAVALQVHSYLHHARPDQWDGTVMTAGILVEHGVVVVGLTPRAIRACPDAVLARMERAYEHARRRPRPDVLAVPIASAS